MTGLGVAEQRLTIHTAVAKDQDEADNDCFDADVEVRTTDGELRLAKDKLEIHFGDAVESMPVSLKRYGCEYTCFIDYNPTTKTGKQVTDFDSESSAHRWLLPLATSSSLTSIACRKRLRSSSPPSRMRRPRTTPG